MMVKGRGDYILEYAMVTEYFSKLYAPLLDSLTSVAISELDTLVVGHLACPRTPWGRKVIDTMDEVLSRIRGTTEYREAVLFWLGTEERKMALQLYDQALLQD